MMKENGDIKKVILILVFLLIILLVIIAHIIIIKNFSKKTINSQTANTIYQYDYATDEDDFIDESDEISEDSEENTLTEDNTIIDDESEIADCCSVTPVESTDSIIVQDEIIVGINNCLLGSVENGEWKNCSYGNEETTDSKNFTIQDLTKYTELFQHQYGENIVKSSDYISQKPENSYTIDDNGIISDEHFRFYFPEDSEISIITNCNRQIFNYEMKELDNTSQYEQFMNQIKIAKNITNIDTIIEKAVEVDYDNDNSKEVILIINTTIGEDGYINSENGRYDAVVAIDNNNYNIIYETYVTKENVDDYTGQGLIKEFLVSDINYDNNAEICIYELEWESPTYLIYEYDKTNNVFNEVLGGNFAW